MRRRAAISTLAASLAAAGSAVAAGERFAPPEGCAVFATMQARSCQVMQLYRCAADAPGDQWMATFDGQGQRYQGRIDAETRWMESIDLGSGNVWTIGQDEADPASFTTLLETGRDDFDFTTVDASGEVLRYVGFDVLTGETVVIDGVPLERTRFESTTYFSDGTLAWKGTGNQYIHREWRRFLSGTEEFEDYAGDRSSQVEDPVEFAFPGEDGFLSTEPRYDCDVMTAGLLP